MSLWGVFIVSVVFSVKRVAVLFGGWSSEREISAKSAQNVSSALREIGYDVFEIEVRKDLRYLTERLYASAPDFIFNVLHGTGGEDGVIQGLLEIFGVPYSNSGVLSSAVCFDKSICKTVVSSRGVRVIDGFEILHSEIPNILNMGMRYPFVVKPVADGSSVGVSLVFNDSDFNKLQNTKWSFGERVLVEKYISGREFTVLVIDGKAIGAIEITFKNKYYDFECKYDKEGSSHIFDYDMPKDSKSEMLKMAEDAYDACHCQGPARVDFRFDGEHPFFLEINTQPGMTLLSLAPDIAKSNGISFSQLVELIIQKSL